MLTLDQFKDMVQAQDRLNIANNPDWKKAGNDWGLAIMCECTELADHIGWKWWKNQPRANDAQLHLELVDIWHFILSAVAELGITERFQRELIEAEQELPELLHINLMTEIDVLKGMSAVAAPFCARAQFGLPMADHTDSLAVAFVALMQKMRLSWDELGRLYKAKAALNLFRWSHGYKDGSYIKDWLGEEDNAYLEKIIAADPDLTVPAIGVLLDARYTVVLGTPVEAA